jgi:hypothetical protein
MEEAVKEGDPPAEAMKDIAQEVHLPRTVPVAIAAAQHVEVTHEAMKTM